jgi:hypothetical protein
MRLIIILLLLPSILLGQYSNRNQVTTEVGHMLVVRPNNEVPLYVNNPKFDFGYQFNYELDKINEIFINPSIGYIETNTVRITRNNYIATEVGWATYKQWYTGFKGYYLWQNKEFCFSIKTRLYVTDVTSNRINFGMSGEIGNLLSQGYFFIPTFFLTANLTKQ